MKTVFADTSYFTALANPKDQWHSAAIEAANTMRCRMVLTDYIVVELGNALAYGRHREIFLSLVSKLQGDPTTTIVAASEELLEQGLSMFALHQDKDWSLTDCISFALMKRRKISEALTADHHFEQAGFKALLRQ